MAKLSPSRLDGRRDKLRNARASAAAAGARVAKLDGELTANANQNGKLEAELMAARDLVAALKKSIKSSRRRKAKLRERRKDAREVSAKTQQRATSAERRYDRAMLADMVEREKQHDLAQHATEPVVVSPASALPAPGEQAALPAGTTPAPPAKNPAVAPDAPPATTPRRTSRSGGAADTTRRTGVAKTSRSVTRATPTT
jgi:septal ring factor EnvC (AmiA/AmiB activator)